MLTLNIVVTAIFTLFIFSSLLDAFSDDVLTAHSAESSFISSRLVSGIANRLSRTPVADLYSVAQSINEDYGLSVKLEQASEYALSKDLLLKLSSAEGLALETENETFILKSIANHPNLVLRIPTARPAESPRRRDLLLTISFYVGLGLVMMLWTLPLIKRLSALTDVAQKFGAGDLSSRIKVSKYSYIKELENRFNKMASQVEHLLEENKLLASALSHDIRTPLACFRFGLHASLEEDDVQKKNNYLHRMNNDLTNMENMLAAFLEFAKMERYSLELQFENTNFADFLSTIVNDMTTLAKRRNKHLYLVLDSKTISVKIDKVWMYRAIANLISNALDYSETKVEVTLRIRSQGSISCIISDDGAGIADADRHRVFDAFVRLDTSRKRNGSNYGLGLAIVKRVCEWHDFDIQLLKSDEKEELPSGASFELSTEIFSEM
ncbi:ATP-binding protein [Ningiella sp. W23]|uniref:ATP-binding protein n=1 Tax=Ningiella sp. W23 TaxID=3023715 RepID=UPI003756F8C2